jgi:dipeptidyl aminopeptidase/acylaminoacyl peptidase
MMVAGARRRARGRSMMSGAGAQAACRSRSSTGHQPTGECSRRSRKDRRMPLLTRLRSAGLLVLLGLLLGTSPVQAAIGLIDPRTPPFALISAAEVAKLKELSAIAPPLTQSPLSPDETTVLASAGDRLVFLDVRDGTTRPVNVAALAGIRRLTNLSWRGPDALSYLGVDLNRRVPVLVTLNRTNGAVTAAPVALPGAPLAGLPALSPDAGRVLIAVVANPESRPAAAEELISPFDRVVPLGLGRPAGFDGEEEPALRVAAVPVTVLVMELASGAVTPVATLPPGTALAALGWSADGRRLALARFSLQQDDIVSPIKSLVNLDAQGALPPDQNPFFQSSVVDLIDFPTGQVRQAALRAAGSGDEFFGDVELSPDGSVLTAVMLAPTRLAGRAHPIYLFGERASLRFYSFDGRLLGAFADRLIETPLGSHAMLSGDEVLINTVIGSDAGFVSYNRASGELRRVPLPAGLSAGMRAAPQSRRIIFLHTSFLRAPELYRVNLDGGDLTPLTAVNAQRAKLNQVRADEVSFTLANGQQRTGYLIQPAGAAFPPQNVPVVVWQEGGPFAPVLNSFATNVENPYNLLPNFGMAVLFMPLVGRLGYGVERFRALYDNDNFGKIDIDEQAEIVRQMIDRGWTSPGRVGITGCSYGGYFAAQSIARHPDLYAAANPQCTLLDLYNEWQFGERTAAVSFIMGGPPTLKLQQYAEASPLYGAARARAATLIFHGTDDFLPVRLTASLHDQLQANGAAVNLLAFVGERHGLQAATSQQMAAQWQIQWFREYLR